MKLRSLELHGFKSFADRTEIEFHDGITAIVGPNGCGKSNISDAIRWVLGEQRPTAIRGGRMEEAIFQGTAARRAIARAEVRLAISNEDGILPVAYRDVVIGRAVHRGGEGDYSVNGSSCRLMDIQDLCRDTGLGANAYSIIESRMVDAILSDRAEERRSLFEEAAGIGRYKDRRRTALRRLEQAEADLARLEDLVGEVASKVRSLARQRGRAERHGELRARRLQLEVAVACARLERIEGRLAEAETALAAQREQEPVRAAGLQREEADAESLRIRLTELERERFGIATRREGVRTRLEELERERLVAHERVSAARARIEAIDAEIAAAAEGRRQRALEIGRLERELEERGEALAALESRASETAEVLETRKALRDERKGEEEAALTALAGVIRSMGQVEAAGEAAHERRRARESEREERSAELRALRKQDEEIARSLEEQTAAAARAEEGRRLAGDALEAAREEARGSREAARDARDELAAREGALASDSARAAALAALLSEGHDLPPVVADLLAAGDELPGVAGVLADAVRPSDADARPVEAHLGALLSAVLVRDWPAVEAVRSWLAARGGEESLLLLPLEPGPRTSGSPVRAGRERAKDGLLARVRVRGDGAAWARALLADVSLNEGFRDRADGAWVTSDGSGRDQRGVVRLGRPGRGEGILARRAELERLEKSIAESDEWCAGRRAEAGRAEAAAQEAARLLEARETECDDAIRSLREAHRERDAVADRLGRIRASAEGAAGRIGELEEVLRSTGEGAEEDRERLAALQARRSEVESVLGGARAAALEAGTGWEAARDAVHELELERARLEADREATEAALARARTASGLLDEREAALQAELAEHREAIETARASVARGEEEHAERVAARQEIDERLRAAEEEIAERRREIEARETALRAARQAERAGAERRHELDLEVAELRGQRATIRERLEAEWEVPFEELAETAEAPGEGGPADWATELDEIRERLARMGPVNLLATHEHAEEQERLEFLTGQRDDLVAARDDLRASIARINSTAAAAFQEVFDQVRENFRRIFISLFEGGECDVWLENPDDPLDSPIEVSASPRGKRTQRIHLLSGGERALTALALLFGIYLAKPSPFCIMDEVDAPLDEANIGRFTAMLERFKSGTQFIVITHNPRTIEAADWVYGVTMQEAGVSSVVGVELQELPRGQVA